MKIKTLLLISLFVALTAICAQISIPLPSGVPITLQILAVFLSAAILGTKNSFISQVVYILIGAVGMPVFASSSSGLPILLGLTGGYIWSFPIASFIIAFIIEKVKFNKNFLIVTKYSLSFLLGLVTIYIFGSFQFYILSGISYIDTIKFTILPFIIPDLMKIIITVPIALKIKKSLAKANLLYT